MRLITFLTVLAIISCACNNSGDADKNTNQVITIDDKKTKIDIRELVYDFQIIELENHEDALIEHLERMDILNDTIYCFSSANNGYIVVFDMQGKFIRRIQHVGRARNEWISARSFFLDSQDENIVITDVYGKKVLIYDMQGRFIHSTPIEWVLQAAKRDDFYYSATSVVTTGGRYERFAEYRLNIHSPAGDQIGAQIKSLYNTYAVAPAGNSEFITNYDGSLLFIPAVDNYIYKLSGDSAIPYYQFEYVGNKKVVTKGELDDSFHNREPIDISDIFYNNIFIETQDLLYYRMGEHEAVDYIYDKNSGEGVLTQFAFHSVGRSITVAPKNMLYPAPKTHYNDRFYTSPSITLLGIPEQYMQGLPEELEEYAERYRKGELNNLIFTYKIKL